MLVLLSLLIGFVAGLRSMTAPAAISIATRCGLLSLSGTSLRFLGYQWVPWILSIAALGELVADKLPFTPSRKAPIPFLARILSGALCGAAIGASKGELYVGTLFGVVGAVAGTLGGYASRKRLVRAIGGHDLPIALLEDLVAITLAAVVFAKP